MHTPVNPARMIGRQSKVHTASGILDGTIVAVGSKGVSIALSSGIVKVPNREVFSIRPA